MTSYVSAFDGGLVEEADAATVDGVSLPAATRSEVHLTGAEPDDTGVTVLATVLQDIDGEVVAQDTRFHVAPGQIIDGIDVTTLDAIPDDLAALTASPEALVQGYDDAIDSGNAAVAYTLWDQSGIASEQTAASFIEADAETESVSVSIGGATSRDIGRSTAGDVGVVVDATTTSGETQQFFCGTYALRRLDDTPGPIFGWRIENAEVSQDGCLVDE